MMDRVSWPSVVINGLLLAAGVVVLMFTAEAQVGIGLLAAGAGGAVLPTVRK